MASTKRSPWQMDRSFIKEGEVVVVLCRIDEPDFSTEEWCEAYALIVHTYPSPGQLLIKHDLETPAAKILFLKAINYDGCLVLDKEPELLTVPYADIMRPAEHLGSGLANFGTTKPNPPAAIRQQPVDRDADLEDDDLTPAQRKRGFRSGSDTDRK